MLYWVSMKVVVTESGRAHSLLLPAALLSVASGTRFRGGKMAKRHPTAQLIYDTIEPLVQELGLELIDVELKTENSARFLRVYVDRRGGVTIDECAKVSELVDPIIENDLKITTHDYFEVSSPGLDRALTEDRDFSRYVDSWVEVSLYKARDGQKKFLGWLQPLEGDLIVIRADDDTAHKFQRSEAAKVKRAIRFN